MTRHLFRLIWNRKRQNFLLTLEIFFSFLTLFGVTLFAVQYANNARQPLGFSIERLWNIEVGTNENDEEPEVKARHRETWRQMLTALRELPQVEAVSASVNSPYGNSSWGGGLRLPGGREVPYSINKSTDEYDKLFDIRVVAGRWFTREDDAATWDPVIINERMARDVFGNGQAVGQILPDEPDPNGPPRDPNEKPKIKRVVGVIDEFRQHGELSAPENYLFHRIRLDPVDPKEGLPQRITIRVRPGTNAQFEETLVRRLMGVAQSWSFEVKPIDQMRTTKLREYSAPLYIIGTIAAFLLMMVALGLTGVVWQSVTQRIREFGLRRAKGATIVNVRTQVLVEMVIMTSIALFVGVALIAQLPLLPLPRDLNFIPAGVFISSIALSAAAIYLLTLACGWYPSRLATKVQPAEALHYE
jgi:putative ABC transport system permease protein